MSKPDAPPLSRALVLGLAAALVVIAFLLGRESMRWGVATDEPRDPTATASAVEPPTAQAPTPDTDTTPRQTVVEARFEDVETGYGGELRLERRADGKIVLSNAGPPVGAPKGTADRGTEPSAPSSTADYFRQMDAIRAGQEVGDPNAFAMGLVKAAFSGSTEGIDALVSDTVEIERQMQAITPPPSAARYHQASLDALAQGRALLEDLQGAIKTQDVQALTGVAGRATALQATAQELERLEKQLRPTP